MILPMVVAGLVAGYMVGKVSVDLPWLRARFDVLGSWDLLALPALALLVLGVHELGHLLGGFLRGMRFLLLIVGPFQWSRSLSGVQFRWFFNPSTMGGLAAATPDPDRPLVPQLKSLVAGGPLASLILAVAALGMAPILEGRPGAYAAAVGVFSMLIAVVTAVPLRAGGFMSDGMQWLELRRGGSAVRDRQTLLRLMGASLAGTRPRDWDPGLVEQVRAIDGQEKLRQVAGRQLALYHAMDREDVAALASHADWLARNIQSYPDGFRQSLAVELCLVATLNGDLTTSREWWRQSRGGVVDAARRSLAEAMLAALEGDATRRDRAIDKARRNLPRSTDRGIALLTADQLVMVERRTDPSRARAAA